MRKFVMLGVLIATMFSHSALADDVEGVIVRLDASANTLRLDDGNRYNLPAELDYSLIREGMKVLLFYDIGGDNQRYVIAMEAEGLELDEEADDGAATP